MKVRLNIAPLALVMAWMAACRKWRPPQPPAQLPPPEFGGSENNLGCLYEGVSKFKMSKSRLPVQLDELVGETLNVHTRPSRRGLRS